MSADLNRLSVNVGTEIRDTVHGYAERQGITVTEAVRRAVKLLSFVERLDKKGAAFVVVEADGKSRQVEFLL